MERISGGNMNQGFSIYELRRTLMDSLWGPHRELRIWDLRWELPPCSDLHTSTTAHPIILLSHVSKQLKQCKNKFHLQPVTCLCSVQLHKIIVFLFSANFDVPDILRTHVNTFSCPSTTSNIAICTSSCCDHQCMCHIIQISTIRVSRNSSYFSPKKRKVVIYYASNL